MIEFKPTDEQKQEIDSLFKKMQETGDLPFSVIEKDGYIALYSTDPYIMKAIFLEAFVSILQKGKA